MDKVIQQNAASAEESASASQEMFAQAEQMKSIIGELVGMVGKPKRKPAGFSVKALKRNRAPHAGFRGSRSSVDQAVNAAGGSKGKPNLEDLIPLDDYDFKEF